MSRLMSANDGIRYVSKRCVLIPVRQYRQPVHSSPEAQHDAQDQAECESEFCQGRNVGLLRVGRFDGKEKNRAAVKCDSEDIHAGCNDKRSGVCAHIAGHEQTPGHHGQKTEFNPKYKRGRRGFKQKHPGAAQKYICRSAERSCRSARDSIGKVESESAFWVAAENAAGEQRLHNNHRKSDGNGREQEKQGQQRRPVQRVQLIGRDHHQRAQR